MTYFVFKTTFHFFIYNLIIWSFINLETNGERERSERELGQKKKTYDDGDGGNKQP